MAEPGSILISTLERSLRALGQRQKGIRPEAYFAYEREDLLAAPQGLITLKDKLEKIKGAS